jgi:hypothetical protein
MLHMDLPTFARWRAWFLSAAVAFSISVGVAGAALAQSTAKAVFEKVDLIGRYAQDCPKPTTDQNLYIIHALEGDRVRRDLYSSSTNRQYSMMIDRAAQPTATELTISGLIADKRYNTVLRLDGKRMRVMEATQDGGAAIVSGGRYTNNNAETPWFNKCLGPDPNIVSGVFSPDRINADIEAAAEKRQKTNPNPAPRANFFKLVFARNINEFNALGRYSVMLLTTISQKGEELPLKRVFHRSGPETPMTRVSNWRSELDAAMLARKIYGPYREDGFYLIPTGMWFRDGQLLIDYAANASGISIAKLPGPAIERLKQFGNLDPAPGARPTLAAFQKIVRERFTGFPVPTSLP